MWTYEIESTFRITLYNKLYIVAPCWTIIDTDTRCTDPGITLFDKHISEDTDDNLGSEKCNS